jgi:hypothetical protein
MVLKASSLFFRDPADLGRKSELDFFSSIKLSNGTFKHTYGGRYEELNRELVRLLVRSGADVDRVLDVGVSSGTTTLELLDDLREAGFSPRITATDLFLEAYLVPLYPLCRALVDGDGFPLQYELFGAAVRPWLRRRDYADGMVVARWLANRICGRRAREVLRRGEDVRPVRLISPRLANHPDVEILQDDIFEHNPALAGRFDLVRAANILTRYYFGEEQLRRGIAHLRSYLAGPGALLLVARTYHGRQDSHGTLFELMPDRRLRAVRRFGQGSELESLMVEAAPAGP